MKFGYNRSSIGLKKVQEFQLVGCTPWGTHSWRPRCICSLRTELIHPPHPTSPSPLQKQYYAFKTTFSKLRQHYNQLLPMQLSFNALPQGQYLITFALTWECISLPYHSQHTTQAQGSSFCVFLFGGVGSRSHFNWHKCLIFTASVTTDSTYR